MNRISYFLLMFFGFLASAVAQTASKATITISNASKIQRSDAVVAVKWSEVTAKYPGIDTGNFKVIDLSTKKEVPFQLEFLGQKVVQNLLVQVSLTANSSVKLSVVPGKPSAVVKKTYARFVPERFDDFAWENDKVAFRMYGKALETRKDNAFGTDVWGKRTTKLVINNWYKSGDYHTDHGEGMDYYSVGLTLGAGDIAPFVKDSIYFSKNYHHWKVLDNGPLRSTFQLGYDEWNVAGKAVTVTKTISLDAGSHLNRVEVKYTYAGEEALPVVIGIVKRKEPGTMLMNELQGVMGYWEPRHGADGITGVGILVPGDTLVMNTDRKHLLSHTTIKSGQPFAYYNGAAWDKAKEITSATAWFEYLNNYKQKLQQPLVVSVQ
ncbi:MAG: DUF4861 domain-containing protein [Pedobacter sp.]|nr:MAG: DUF4861 domain-containing protein [Pedobacter sp.]